MPESFERKVKLNENRKEYFSEAQVERKPMPELSNTPTTDIKIDITLGMFIRNLSKEGKVILIKTVLDSLNLCERADIIQAELGRIFYEYDNLDY